ncbi:MAG: PTS sugar transporter subunit IIA [Mycoplasmatales bacterium]
MVKLSENQIEILTYLINNNITKYSDIVDNNNIKIKLVKKSIAFLQVFLLDYDSSIELKHGVGVIFKTNKTKDFWNNFIAEHSPIKIEDKVLFELVGAKDYITMSYLSDKLFCSNNTISKIISTYEFNVYKKQNTGIKLNLTSLDKKILSREIILKYIDPFYLDNSIIKFFKNEFNYTLDDDKLEHIKDLLLKLNLPNRDRIYILEYITLILGVIIGYDNKVFNQKIHEVFNTSFDIETNEYYNNIISLNNEKINNKKLLSDMLFYLENKLGILFDFDVEVFIKFSNHIDFLIKNRRTLPSVDLSLIRQISGFKEKYPYSFEIGEYARQYLLVNLNHNIPIEESFYMAIYFQIHFDNQTKHGKINAIIISDHGVGMKHYIAGKITKEARSINITGIYSISEYVDKKDKTLKNTQLIITTVDNNIDSNGIEIIKIDSISIDESISTIKKIAKQQATKKSISTIINNEHIFIKVNFQNKDALLKKINKLLIDELNVSENYLDTLYEREATGSVVNNYLALPHGNPKEVLQNTIVIITLEKPITWNNEEVYVIILFVLTAEFIKNNNDHLSSIFKNMADLNFVSYMRRSKTPEAIKDILISKIRD